MPTEHPVSPAATPSGLEVPFDQYQRYRITAEVAGAFEPTGSGPRRALDVGGHFTDADGRPRRPIRDFLPAWQTVTVDLPVSPLTGYVRARGDELPFRERSFDLVSSVDVLEHVPADRREQLIGHLLRTSRRVVLVAAPFASPLVSQAEALLAAFVERTCGYVQGQLREHRERGLPDLQATRKPFTAAGWPAVVFRYGNLWRWLFMMIDKHAVAALPGGDAVHARLDARYNAHAFASDTDAPCYRHFIVAARDANDPVLAFVRRRFAGEIDDSPGPGLTPDAVSAAGLIDLATLHAENQHLLAVNEPLRRAGEIARLDAECAELRRHLDVRVRQVEELQDLVRSIEASPSHRVARAVKRLLGRTS